MKDHVLVTHAPPVAVQPAMELREWRVLEDMDAELLLIGLHVDSDRIRISTPVVAWDYGQRIWTTQSGRMYRTALSPRGVSDAGAAGGDCPGPGSARADDRLDCGGVGGDGVAVRELGLHK